PRYAVQIVGVQTSGEELPPLLGLRVSARHKSCRQPRSHDDHLDSAAPSVSTVSGSGSGGRIRSVSCADRPGPLTLCGNSSVNVTTSSSGPDCASGTGKLPCS